MDANLLLSNLSRLCGMLRSSFFEEFFALCALKRIEGVTSLGLAWIIASSRSLISILTHLKCSMN
jgi:hypothetical protein